MVLRIVLWPMLYGRQLISSYGFKTVLHSLFPFVKQNPLEDFSSHFRSHLLHLP